MDRDGIYTAILKEELVPALGCTEPIALAYASAECRKLLGELPDKAVAECSGNIIKNVKSVIIPNTGGMKGIEAAVAAGMIGGDASRGLEVLSAVKEEDLPAIRDYIAAKRVSVKLLHTTAALHFIISMENGSESASVEVIHQGGKALLDLGDGGRIRQRIGLLDQGRRNLLLIHLGNVLLLMGQTVYQNAARRQVLREAAQAPFAGGHTGVTGQPFLQLGVFEGPAQQRQNPIVAPS